MAKKNKYALETPFTLEVSNALRFHAGMAEALESQRQTAKEDRDAALAELAEIGDEHGDEALALKERHSDAVVAFKDLNDRIHWHSRTALDLCKKGDKPGVEVLYEKPAEPPPKLKEAKTKKGDDTAQLKMQPEAPVAAGEDQQLAADISELELSGPLQAKLRKANVNTIAQLVVIADDSKRNLRDELNLGNATVDTVEDALVAYRKKHRRAIAEADKEGAAPKR